MEYSATRQLELFLGGAYTKSYDRMTIAVTEWQL